MTRKWIAGYEGLYEVTTDGEIIRHTSLGTKVYTGRQHKSGYLQIALSREGKARTYLVHRLVAEAFIDNTENLPVVDHIDEDKTNNTVSNLRWCTLRQNTEYYCTKDGRRYYIELAKARKRKIKAYELHVQEQAKELKGLFKLLEKKEKLLAQKEKQLKLAEEKLARYEKALDNIADRTLDTTVNYPGYADTTGVKFKSVEHMVEITGKRVRVNGVSFDSCLSAASYITKEEAKLGKTRNKHTVSKELRRFLQGLRPAWDMYGRYTISHPG